MASQLGYSDFLPQKNQKNQKKNNKKKNSTIKNKQPSKKVKELLNYIEGFSDNEDGDSLEDYNTEPQSKEKIEFPPNPILTKQPEDKEETDEFINVEGFSKLDNNKALNNNYYNNYIPYYSKTSNSSMVHGTSDELMSKLNYVVHLLEENKDEKTHNVTEELVLYLFLGVFVIFVVDSFAKVGKYTRNN
tara:strand:+ start:204 stop:770 length:567 start_codon:yes stop_codon:yes gene_type:complete